MALTPNLALPYPVPADTVDVPRDVKALADKLDTYTSMAPPEAVHRVGAGGEPAFQAGWSNQGTPFETTGFWRADGVSYVVGWAQKATQPAVGETIFVLPAAYWPPARVSFACPCAAAGGVSPGATVRMDIYSNGLVVVSAPPPGGSGSFSVSLDGIYFRHV